MQCFQSVGIIFLLLSQGASKQIRRRRNIENNPVMKQSADQIKSIIIKLNGVLVLTISDYRNYSHLYYEYMKFCLHLDNISYVSTEMVSYNNTPKHFKDSNTDTLLQQKEKIFSAFKEFISTNIDEFLKTQCLKSVGEAIRHADDSLESMEITRWRESQNLWIMQNIPEIPFTKSYDVQINVQIYGVPTFTRIPKNNHTLHFELCRRNGSTIIDYVSNYKDPKTDPILLEGKEVARVYNEAISNDFNQLLKDYLLELNVEKSVPVNNTEFLEEMDSILENRHDTPGKTLHELDQLSLAWAVQDRPVTVVKDDVAVVVPDKLVRGLRVSSAAGRSEFEKYSFDFLDEAPSPRILRSQESEMVVTLPPSALTQRQVSFVVFQKESLFPSQPNGFVVNSLVISVNIKNVTHFHGGEVIDIHFRPIATPGRNESRSCAYWHFLENNTGYWSQEGCNFIRATEDGMLDTCRCNHLTHFAEILVPKTVFSEANERALEILTIAGCSLSIMGLIIVGATALLFRSWRQEFRNKIWLQMCMAILILVVTFLVVIFVQNDRYHMKCLLLGVTLHYAVLASFCWMLVAAVLAYRQLVLVFARDVPHKLFRATVFAWGAPGVVCGVLLSVSSESYAGQFQEMTPGGNFCYPKGLSLWLAVYAPISVILVTNWTLLALILRSLFCSKKIRRYGEGAEALRSVSVSCKLGFLFGLPWVFGLFASNVVAAYLFTLTATFQGFVSFVLLVIGNKKTRELWANKMFKKRNIMPMALVRDSDCSADSANQNGRDTAVPILYYTSTR